MCKIKQMKTCVDNTLHDNLSITGGKCISDIKKTKFSSLMVQTLVRDILLNVYGRMFRMKTSPVLDIIRSMFVPDYCTKFSFRKKSYIHDCTIQLN